MAHVLVIDDDVVVLSLVSGILEACGHSVSTAIEGGAGMSIFGGRPVDLVITDIVMPGQEGMATIREIRRASAKVPILAMSESNTIGRNGNYLDVALLLGANAALEKPITPDGLMSAVARLLAPETGRRGDVTSARSWSLLQDSSSEAPPRFERRFPVPIRS